VTAFSSTIHKSQGITAKYGVVINSGKAFAMGLFYVAFSRATAMDSIFTLGEFGRSHFKTHPMKYLAIKTEMARLRSLASISGSSSSSSSKSAP
jgi:ATP-dependent exoDNAse (exonuclease V) alpha subunit